MKRNIFINRNILKVSVFMVLTLLTACVEPYELKTETFEKTVVIEGIINSEIKNQEIKISETYALEDDTIAYVTNANVEVISSEGDSYNFSHTGEGVYTSIESFGAQEEVGYQLNVNVDGEAYQSEEEMIKGYSNLQEVKAQRAFNDEGELGVAITVESNATSADTKYYRYTYEETYKIVSPYTAGKEFIVNNNGLQLVNVPPDVEREICYNTLGSNKGVLNNTSFQSNNDQDDVLIKFMSVDDPKILNRYSILVKQQVISGDAFRFFETLNELSNSENVFSQNQPGFLTGNIININNEDENIVGYFEVASVEEKRLFFNFLDIFEVSERPDPRADCGFERPLAADLPTYILNNTVQYLSIAPPATDPLVEGPWYTVPKECIDCRVLGTNTQPEFWIENE